MKFLVTLAARMLLIWAFVQFGWMSLLQDGRPIQGFGQYLLFAFIGGILLAIAAFILVIPYLIVGAMAIVATLGLFAFVFDTMFMALLIWVISLVFPANLVLHGFWWTVLCAFILSLAASVIDGLFDDKKPATLAA